jgi:hypothetical protein
MNARRGRRPPAGPGSALVWACLVLLLVAVPVRPASAQTYDSMMRDAQQQLAKMNEFASLESESRRRLKAGRFDEARQIARQALALNVANRRANALLADIDAAERAAAPVPTPAPPARESGTAVPTRPPGPGRAPVPPREPRGRAAARPPVDAGGGRAAQVLQQALRAYFAGDYAAVLDLRQAAEGREPARLLLYAACSEVALGLLDQATAGERFARAQVWYERATSASPATALDRRVISPRIMEVLEQRAPVGR